MWMHSASVGRARLGGAEIPASRRQILDPHQIYGEAFEDRQAGRHTAAIGRSRRHRATRPNSVVSQLNRVLLESIIQPTSPVTAGCATACELSCDVIVKVRAISISAELDVTGHDSLRFRGVRKTREAYHRTAVTLCCGMQS